MHISIKLSPVCVDARRQSAHITLWLLWLIEWQHFCSEEAPNCLIAITTLMYTRIIVLFFQHAFRNKEMFISSCTYNECNKLQWAFFSIQEPPTDPLWELCHLPPEQRSRGWRGCSAGLTIVTEWIIFVSPLLIPAAEGRQEQVGEPVADDAPRPRRVNRCNKRCKKKKEKNLF